MSTQTDQENRQEFRRLALWGNANALAQKFQLENAIIAKQTGAKIDLIPFGNQTTTNINQSEGPSFLGKAAQIGMLALGMGGGGLGLAALASSLLDKAPAVPAPIQQSIDEIPLIFDYEFKPNE